MVELCPKEVQKPSKERVRRQGKSTVDVGGKKNTLTLPRLRLRFLPRKPRRVIGDQPPFGQVVEVFLGDPRVDPVALDPALRQAGSRGGSAPTGRLPLRPRRRLLCPLQSRRLLLPHRRRRDAYGAVALGRERARRRSLKRRRGNENALFKKPRSDALYEVASEWLTGRPGRSCQIP